MISVSVQGKPLNITVIQVCVPTTNAKEAEIEWVYEDLQHLFTNAKKKRYPFHHGGLKCKIRKSTGKIGLGVQNKAKASKVLSSKHIGHSKHPFPTLQEVTLHMNLTK